MGSTNDEKQFRNRVRFLQWQKLKNEGWLTYFSHLFSAAEGEGEEEGEGVLTKAQALNRSAPGI